MPEVINKSKPVYRLTYGTDKWYLKIDSQKGQHARELWKDFKDQLPELIEKMDEYIENLSHDEWREMNE